MLCTNFIKERGFLVTYNRHKKGQCVLVVILRADIAITFPKGHPQKCDADERSNLIKRLIIH